MNYLYETHLHTCQGSACGVSTGKEHAQFYYNRGYQGIIITDHFFGGNTAVDRRLPWREQIEQFCSGYEDAKEEGLRLGLDVFFGWEQTFEGDDYLVYGLSPAWLLEHPEAALWTRAEQLFEVHRWGGCVIQAHPFRERDYLSRILLGLQFADGVEIANAGNDPLSDACAMRYAKENHLPVTAGSDNHLSHPGMPLMGISLPKPLGGIEDYVRLIREHAAPELLVSPERFEIKAGQGLYLPCYLLNEKEEPVRYERPWLPLQ
ncbi:MAG: histidinol-phosphatase [Provencibacterium sp.]|jgi:hypothetical protein|nr:histidinol-phosphatase [Provencibacterium sp.]